MQRAPYEALTCCEFISTWNGSTRDTAPRCIIPTTQKFAIPDCKTLDLQSFLKFWQNEPNRSDFCKPSGNLVPNSGRCDNRASRLSWRCGRSPLARARSSSRLSLSSQSNSPTAFRTLNANTGQDANFLGGGNSGRILSRFHCSLARFRDRLSGDRNGHRRLRCRWCSYVARNESEKPHDGKRVAPSTHVTKPVSEGSPRPRMKPPAWTCDLRMNAPAEAAGS